MAGFGFGQTSAFGGFGAAPTAAPTFGQPAGAFGSTGSAFGQPQQPSAFGGFGQPAAAPTFGATSAPAFGAPQAAPTFGAQPQQSAFGGGGFGGFGQTQQTATPFGASTGGGFGAAAQPAGGSAFGFNVSTPFGASSAATPFGQSAPAFGAASQPASGGGFGFGGSAFGASTGASAFGAPAFGAGGMGGAAAGGQPNTTIAPYAPSKGPDGTGANAGSQPATYVSITHMQQYQNYSFEELRAGDYAMNRKKKDGSAPTAFGAGASTGFSAFGAPANPTAQTSIFGQTPAFGQNPAQQTSVFGQQNMGAGGFGSTGAAPAFGASTGSAFGGFGQASGASSAFGAKPAGFGGFGATTTTTFGQPAGGFGAQSSSAFGGGQSTGGFGGFGASTGTAFGGFGQTSGSAFGASSGGGFGGFGAKPAFGQSSQPAFGGGAFGQASQPAFGGASAFGAGTAAKPGGLSFGGGAFGASTGGGFGQATGGFGQSTGGMFGASATPFGQNTGGAFGGGGFGQSSQGGFGQASQGGFGGGFGQQAGQQTGAFGAFGAKPGGFGQSTGGGFGGFGGMGQQSAGAFGGGGAFGMGQQQTGGMFGAQGGMVNMTQQQQQQQQMLMMPKLPSSDTGWMADVQSNPYGNLSLGGSVSNPPTMFSSDPNLRINGSTSTSTIDNSPLRLQGASRVSVGGTFRARSASSTPTHTRRLSGGGGGVSRLNSSISGNTGLSQSLLRHTAKPSPSLNSSFTPSITVKPSKFLEYLERKEADSSSTTKLFSPSPEKRKETPQRGGMAGEMQGDRTEDMSTTEHSRNALAAVQDLNGSSGWQVDDSMGGWRPASEEDQRTTSTRQDEDANASRSSPQRWGQQSTSPGAAPPAQQEMSMENGSNGAVQAEKWRLLLRGYEFTAPSEPKGLEVPAGMLIRRQFEADEEASIEVMEAYDLARDSYSPADGSGGEAVCAVLLRYISIHAPLDVEVSLRVKILVRMRSGQLEKWLSKPKYREQTYNKFEKQLRSEQWGIPPGGFRWTETDQDLLTMVWVPLNA